jgi:hypothetical protein
MSYVDNLRDDTKKSNYLITIDPNYWIERNEINNPGSTNAYIDFPYGEPIGTTVITSQYFYSLRSSLTDQFAWTTQPGISDTGVLSGYNSEEQRYYFDDSTFILNNARPAIRFRMYLSSLPVATYKDPTLASGDKIQWVPAIVSNPRISRDVSDLLNGFLPTQISGFDISAVSELVQGMMWKSHWKNVPFTVYHVVGDVDDVTNVKKIFSGTVASAETSQDTITLSLSDGTSSFDESIVLPSNSVDFSELGVSYRVDSRDKRNIQRKIYGAVSGVGATNVTRPADEDSPTTSENRKWVFASYNGTDSTIADAIDTYDANGTRFTFIKDSPNTGTDAMIIVRYFDKTSVTDNQILEKMENFGYSGGDDINITLDEYPSEVFTFKAERAEYGYITMQDLLDVGLVNNSYTDEFFAGIVSLTNLRAFYCTIRGVFIDEWAAQASATVNDFLEDLHASTTLEVIRPIISSCYLRDSSGVSHRLKYLDQYTIFRDSTEKFYGIELSSTVETDLSISTIRGNETVFGRVYGETPTGTIGNPSTGIVVKTDDSFSSIGARFTGAANFEFGNSYANNSTMNILYEFLSSYCGIDDSLIDTTRISAYDDYDFHSIVTDGSDKYYYSRRDPNGRRHNFAIPREVSSEMPSKKDFILEILKLKNMLIFINNEGKWTFRYLNEQAGQDPVKTIYDSDYSLVSQEIFENTDIYGFTKTIDNFMEFAAKSANDKYQTNGYWYSGLGFTLNSSKEINELESNYSLAWVDEESVDEFSSEANYSFTNGSWAENTVIINGNTQHILSIRVSREFFTLDIGDCVQVVSSTVGGGTKNLPINRKYIVLGIEQGDDYRILKLSDVAQTLIDFDRDVSIPSQTGIIDLEF